MCHPPTPDEMVTRFVKPPVTRTSFILIIFLAPSRIAARIPVRVSEAKKMSKHASRLSVIAHSPASRTAPSAYGPTSTRQRPGSTRQARAVVS